MSDIVIKAEGLGKKYTIGHQAANGRYLALRDVVMQNARNLWRTTKDLLRSKPIIQGDDLEEVWALKDVSFEIRRGEAVGIIGRNGAGKSTLLKVLSRITEPSAGRVTIKGRVASLLEVGTGFHPELTGRENVYLNGAILGMTRSEINRKFDEIVAFAEIEKFLDTPVKRYSSGMYVRLAFAVAAHLEPEILLVDEVLAVGDASFQKKCLGKMGDVAKEGRTVLFVSHNMSAIQRFCQSALWLSNGRVEPMGQVNDVVRSYVSVFDTQAQVLSVEYPNDPSKPMQLIRVSLREPDSGVFPVSAELVFELEVLTRSPVDGAYISVNVLDAYDSVVYWTSDIDSKRFQSPTAGYSILTCRCPAYLLTSGKYAANFGIVSLGRDTIDHIGDKRIIFAVQDDRSILAAHGVSQPGVTAVPSEWSAIWRPLHIGPKDTRTQRDCTHGDPE